jgi:hypothetical protein
MNPGLPAYPQKDENSRIENTGQVITKIHLGANAKNGEETCDGIATDYSSAFVRRARRLLRLFQMGITREHRNLRDGTAHRAGFVLAGRSALNMADGRRFSSLLN